MGRPQRHIFLFTLNFKGIHASGLPIALGIIALYSKDKALIKKGDQLFSQSPFQKIKMKTISSSRLRVLCKH